MRRAEFDGECQLCGRRQKLPSEALSLHGYTVRWGFFSGVCPGSRHKPFEVSADLLPAQIAWATQHAEGLRARATAVVAEASPDRAHVYVYREARGRDRGGYRWEEVAIRETDSWTSESGTAYKTFGYTDKDGRVRKLDFGYADRVQTVEEAAVKLAVRRAEGFEKEAVQTDGYVKWLKERLASWTPRPLAPAVRHVPDPNRKPRRRRRWR